MHDSVNSELILYKFTCFSDILQKMCVICSLSYCILLYFLCLVYKLQWFSTCSSICRLHLKLRRAHCKAHMDVYDMMKLFCFLLR